MGQLEDFRASLKRKDSAVNSDGELPVKSIAKAKQEKMKRRRAYQNSGLIVLFPVSYTLCVLVRQFQCQVCINHDLATDLTDCRTDPFAVLDSPRCGRAATEESPYSFEAIDQVLLFHQHFLHILPRLHFKVFLYCHLHCHHRIASTFLPSHNH